MMAFPAYDLDKLLHTSYKRVMQLFCLADKASAMKKFEIALGTAALHDAKLGQTLQQVELTATIVDKEAMKNVYNEQSKAEADAAVQRMLAERKKGRG